MSIVDAWGCDEVDGEISSSSGNTYPVDGKNKSFEYRKEKNSFFICIFFFVNFCMIFCRKKTVAII